MDHLRLVSSNPDWDEIAKLRQLNDQLHNEVRFYRSDRARVAEEAKRKFDAGWRKGFNTGLFAGCVAGTWLTVALAFVWTLIGSAGL